MSKTDGEQAPKPPLYGVWSVDELVSDGAARPPLLTDPTRWRRVVFAYPGYVELQPIAVTDARSRSFYAVAVDAKAKTLTLTKGPRSKDPKWRAVLAYSQPAPDRLVLDGVLDGHTIHAVTHREDRAKFLLVNRGFHWINEYPFNR
jgi:hypothetical protein